MIPREYSSGERQRLGGLSKQGNPLLRFPWGEAGAHAVGRDPELKRFYRRKLNQKGLGKASVAVARKLGIRLWIMLRIRSNTTSSVGEDRSSRKAVMPVRGCQKRAMVRTVTGRLIRLPASLEEGSVVKGSRRPLHSWASRITAGSAGAMERSSSGGKRRRSAWRRSCRPLRPSCACECTSRWPTSVPGFERL
jgi:Transposase IS116/IS110/IS902 family